MKVSGQLHAPAALPPGKEPLIPTGWEAGWAPEPAWIFIIICNIYIVLKTAKTAVVMNQWCNILI
jgi:hypothetical protein